MLITCRNIRSPLFCVNIDLLRTIECAGTRHTRPPPPLDLTMANSRQVVTSLLTEHFRYTPLVCPMTHHELKTRLTITSHRLSSTTSSTSSTNSSTAPSPPSKKASHLRPPHLWALPNVPTLKDDQHLHHNKRMIAHRPMMSYTRRVE